MHVHSLLLSQLLPLLNTSTAATSTGIPLPPSQDALAEIFTSAMLQQHVLDTLFTTRRDAMATEEYGELIHEH